MTRHPLHQITRLAGRAAAATVLTTLVLAPLLLAPAMAETPETWEDPPPVSPLHAVLLIGGWSLLLFVVITLLVMAPSLARGEGYRPGQAWRGEREWFGGPRAGVEATDDVDPIAIESGQRDLGGASARW